MRTFTWSIDDQDYKSANVSQSMRFHSVMASAQVHTREVGSGGMVPYVTGGLGIYGFSNEISGLIYPGQTGKTLDQNLKLDPYKDEWPALTFSVGGGVTFVGSERILIDIRCRYKHYAGRTPSSGRLGAEEGISHSGNRSLGRKSNTSGRLYSLGGIKYDSAII